MELIGKISKGTKMDQIYIPKNRLGFSNGDYVKIIPINKEHEDNYYTYNLNDVPPIKIELARRIFQIIDSTMNYDNIIITGSFLETGFNFKDIDVIIIAEKEERIERKIKEKLKIETHMIFFNKNLFVDALKIDPIWRLMLNRCIAKKRLAPLPQPKLAYKYLDAQLIRSKSMLNDFGYLTGKEKYKLTRNMITIYLFINAKKLSGKGIEKEIEEKLKIKIEDLKNNIVDKDFFKRYKNFYIKLEKEVIKNAAKQEKTN